MAGNYCLEANKLEYLLASEADCFACVGAHHLHRKASSLMHFKRNDVMIVTLYF